MLFKAPLIMSLLPSFSPAFCRQVLGESLNGNNSPAEPSSVVHTKGKQQTPAKPMPVPKTPDSMGLDRLLAAAKTPANLKLLLASANKKSRRKPGTPDCDERPADAEPAATAEVESPMSNGVIEDTRGHTPAAHKHEGREAAHQLATFVEHAEDFEWRPNGKIVCTLTNHELIPNLEAVVTYLDGKKYQKALRAALIAKKAAPKAAAGDVNSAVGTTAPSTALARPTPSLAAEDSAAVVEATAAVEDAAAAETKDGLMRLRSRELRDLCAQRGVQATGTKVEMTERLLGSSPATETTLGAAAPAAGEPASTRRSTRRTAA